jgi:hypothetical protein
VEVPRTLPLGLGNTTEIIEVSMKLELSLDLHLARL